MKNTIKKYSLIVLSLLLISITSCLDDEEVDFGKGPIVVRFAETELSGNFLKDGSGAVYDYELPIEYHGADGLPLDKDVTVTIGVSDESTAVKGVQFDIPQTEFTIPAGEKVAKAVVKVYAEELDADNPPKAVLEIVSSSETVSDKNKVDLILQAICPSDLAGDYKYSNGNEKNVTITQTGPGTYLVSGDNRFNTDYSFNITDVCGKITVTGGFLEENYGIAVSGEGSYDEATGNITIVYTVDGYFSNREMVFVKQ